MADTLEASGIGGRDEAEDDDAGTERDAPPPPPPLASHVSAATFGAPNDGTAGLRELGGPDDLPGEVTI